MPEQHFNGKQVSSVFIKVCAKGVSERMAGETVFQAKFCFFCKNKMIYRIRGHGPSGVIPVGEQEPHWPAGMEPVLCQDIQGILGKDSIPVGTCFGMADMYTHGRAADIFGAESADFPNPKAGGIHESQQGFMLKVGKRLDKIPNFFLGRDKRKVRIKSPHRELCGIPGFV